MKTTRSDARARRTGARADGELLPATLGPARRFGLTLAGWTLFIAAGPGVLVADGSALAFLGLALWAFAVHRPGRRAFGIEVLAGSVHGAVTLYWIAYVWGPALVYSGIGWGVYMASAGLVLRTLARRLPLPLATALAFVGIEAVRAILVPPFGMRWLQLGHHAATTPLLAESARLWGPTGLSIVLACAAGLVARVLMTKKASRVDLAWGLGPLVLGLGYGALTSAPAMVDGPRVLLVQPAFPQWRKQARSDVREKFLEQLDLTLAGIEEARAAGRPAPDLVCWGETMVFIPLVDDSLDRVDVTELDVYPWWKLEASELPRVVQNWRKHEAAWVGETLFGLGRSPRLLPEGTSFLSGAEVMLAEGGRLEHHNAIALWESDGVRRQPHAAKVHLVPGAETMMGLEHLLSVRDFIWKVAGYVPDFQAAERTGVFELATRDGRRYHFGATVCFDNAFPDVFAEPLRRGPLDFHVVVSNEAWYLDSFEMDQMMAFSRIYAIATGRSIVRATNSGVTAAIGPDGRELARLVKEGRDREVPGTLEVGVPVPLRDAEGNAPRPLFVWLEPWIDPAWVVLVALFLAVPAVRARYRRTSTG